MCNFWRKKLTVFRDLLNHLMLYSIFVPPENIKKALVFWSFKGVQKWNVTVKCVNNKSLKSVSFSKNCRPLKVFINAPILYSTINDPKRQNLILPISSDQYQPYQKQHHDLLHRSPFDNIPCILCLHSFTFLSYFSKLSNKIKIYQAEIANIIMIQVKNHLQISLLMLR